MFGDIGVALLKMAGMTGNVPTAILAADIPAVLRRLEGGLATQAAAAPAPGTSSAASPAADESADSNQAVPLGNRAFPLLSLLRAARAAGADVLVRATR